MSFVFKYIDLVYTQREIEPTYTRSFEIGLKSAAGQKLECFRLKADTTVISIVRL